MSIIITRRALVSGLGLGSAALLSGCDKLGENEGFRNLLSTAERGNFAIQRSLQGRMALAREFGPMDISPIFKQNGSRLPIGDEYAAHVSSKFADWRLGVDGLVSTSQSLSMDAVMAMPKRTQITRHDCVEGWSAIGKWMGVPLKLLLDAAGLKSTARYIVFHCADKMSNGAMYYESIDLVDAMHPQTMLAWALNDETQIGRAHV